MKWYGRFEGYNVSSLRKDLVSGLIVSVIAIPLGMAFAIASGVKPEYGIYTTIVAGVLISLFGGSRYQIGGPTGAFIPILLAVVMQYGYENLLIAGIMAGIILVFMGLCKMGMLIKYIPRPVTIGFTSGIAVIIFTGQIGNFLGLEDLEKHENFIANIYEIFVNISAINVYSVIVALLCLIIILATPRIMPKVPGSLIGIMVSSVMAALLFDGQLATIGTAYGGIPNALPQFHIPEITWDRIVVLIKPALVIAILGGIESLLSAVVADGMTGSRHDSNRELIGQGVANIVTPFFGGIPATGAIARTATNIRMGAVSPISGVVHGVIVLLVLVLFAPFASDIPLASIAPVLMIVAWNMSERKEFAHVMKTRTSDSAVLLITFLFTVLTNLTTAMGIGLLLAVVLFVKRMSDMLKVVKVLPDRDERHQTVRESMVSNGHDCPQINIYNVEGPLFFGAANMFEKSIMDVINKRPQILLLRLGGVPFMDTTGESNLASLITHFKKAGGLVLISEIQPQPLQVLKSAGLYEEIGATHFFEHTGDAINYAFTQLDRNFCQGCKHDAFYECSDTATVKASVRQKVIALQ